MIRWIPILGLKINLWPRNICFQDLPGLGGSEEECEVRDQLNSLACTSNWSPSKSYLVPYIKVSWSLCKAFYIPPDQESNSLYPYSNTFNVTGPIDWSKAGGSNSLDRFRAIGTHNSYHVQQYEEPGIRRPSGLSPRKLSRWVNPGC